MNLKMNENWKKRNENTFSRNINWKRFIDLSFAFIGLFNSSFRDRRVLKQTCPLFDTNLAETETNSQFPQKKNVFPNSNKPICLSVFTTHIEKSLFSDSKNHQKRIILGISHHFLTASWTRISKSKENVNPKNIQKFLFFVNTTFFGKHRFFPLFLYLLGVENC